MMDSNIESAAHSHGGVIVEGDDPSRSTSSAPSSAPSFYTDLGSPKYMRSRTPSPPTARTGGAHSAQQVRSPSSLANSTVQDTAAPGHPDSGPPFFLPVRSLSPTVTPSPTPVRSPVAIPPPSCMPLAEPATAPGSMVTYVRASPPGGMPYGPFYPYTQPQTCQPLLQQHAMPPQPMVPQAGTASASTLQRANSAPPSRMLTFGGRLSIATNSVDWVQHPTEAAAAAGGGVNSTSGTQSMPLEPTAAATPTGSVVKPYGFLPPPSTPPPLKPRWPTARLVSSRRSAASAFTSFAAAPTAALRITSLGAAATTPAKPAVPPASAAAPASRTQSPADTKTPMPRRFSSHRTRCLADNLAFLHRGNTYNPPLNERITRLFEVVLPPPSSTSLILHAIPSPMTPPAPVPPPPPDAIAHLDRALQLRREAVVAQRHRVDGLNAAADMATAAVNHWSSRRVGGGTGGAAAQGTALRSISINPSAAWMARSGDWVDGGGGNTMGGGGGPGGGLGVILGGITASSSVPLPRGPLSEEADTVEGVWGLPYMIENDAASAVAASAVTAAMRNSGTEVLHLQGVSYRATKAATRALADMQRPGTSLRMQGAPVREETSQYPPYPQQHPPYQQDNQQHPPPRQHQQHQQAYPRARSHSHPQPPSSKSPASIWV